MINFPTAKINLGLHIIEKRSDNFHNIETIFYPIRIADALEFIPALIDSFSQSGISILGPNHDNLCMKALKLLRNDFTIPPLAIHLHKNIPIGAGLGGGSSDGATMLKMLNEYFDLKLTVIQLQNYGRQLGADCAFFINNKPVLAEGKGDELKMIEIDLSGYEIVVVMPQDIHISTAAAYSGVTPSKPIYKLNNLAEEPIENWKNILMNDFETSIFKCYPRIAELKQELYELGAIYASMSGSGAALYGIFKEKINLSYLKNVAIFEG